MKRHVVFLLLFLSTAAINKLMAQDSSHIRTLPPVIVSAATMKVPKKVWNQFADYFTGAYNSRFFKINKDWLAKFVLDKQENRALFTKHGYLVYHISYGYETNLPEEIRKQIKATYDHFSITRAIKIEQTNRVVWVVNLETNNQFILARLEDGIMEEIQQFNKSLPAN
jgi:hypothetical protein